MCNNIWCFFCGVRKVVSNVPLFLWVPLRRCRILAACSRSTSIIGVCQYNTINRTYGHNLWQQTLTLYTLIPLLCRHYQLPLQGSPTFPCLFSHRIRQRRQMLPIVLIIFGMSKFHIVSFFLRNRWEGYWNPCRRAVRPHSGWPCRSLCLLSCSNSCRTRSSGGRFVIFFEFEFEFWTYSDCSQPLRLHGSNPPLLLPLLLPLHRSETP
jgi:hypothetical protein